MRKSFTLLCLALFTSVSALLAQDIQLSGKIADETNTPLPGVNIVVKGTTTGTITDQDGNYKLIIPASIKNPVIVFKFVGYSDKEVPLNAGENNPVISFKMANEDKGLNTVVISASRRKEKLIDAPASVTVLTAEKLEVNTPLNVTDNLKKVPGVHIVETGLMSSNVVTRGFNNIFSGSLMTLVDNRIASVPSLKVNAYQLIPTASSDVNRMEIVRGPGSALYGPNASDGVLYIETKSPLDMKKKFEASVGFTGGFGAPSTNVWVAAPELRISGKVKDWFGYKVSASYLKGSDWRYYDSREPKVGDNLWFGSRANGVDFVGDSIRLSINDTTRNHPALLPFDRKFGINKYTVDGRFDFKLPKDISIILNGGLSNGTNLELTGLGAAQALNWKYYYGQIRLKWKELFVQYYFNGSNSGDTYLIPQVGSTAQPPHKVFPLVDRSLFHVVQIQHSWRPTSRLNLIYGADFQMTRPNTLGTIHGRYENNDNTNQYGGYVQADLDVVKKLKFVTAFRLDYHDRMKELMFSPRAALVFKPHQDHTLRLTYNRAFSAPSSLNLFLDLSNGYIPNGINVRGLGNPNGMDYRYGSDGSIQMISPYTNSWMNPNDRSINSIAFDSMTHIIANGLASKTSYPSSAVQSLLGAIFAGIAGDTGTITGADHRVIDYLTKQDWQGGFSKLEKIKSTVTQTWELGYKGSFLNNRLMISFDAYYTRIKNFVSPLTLGTASVILDSTGLMNALGPQNMSGQLYRNLQKIYPLNPTLNYDQLLVGISDPITGKPLLDGAYTGGTPNGTCYDDLVVLLQGANKAIPVGSITPDDSKVGKDVILVYRNLGKVDIFGIDMGITYEVIPGLDVSFAGSFVNKDRIPLLGAAGGFVGLNTPKYKTSVAIDHTFKKIGIGYGINWRWQDAFPANSAVYVGDVNAANFIDLRLSYKPQTKYKNINGLLFSVNVTNLLDYKFSQFPGTPQIGRMIMGKVNYTFGF